MNHRQWKKSYKKRHGYNPPVSEDKRKRNKQMAREFITAYTELDLSRELAKMLAAAGETIADIFDGLSKSMRAAAEYYRDISEAKNENKCGMNSA